jgi:hypothetical protein
MEMIYSSKEYKMAGKRITDLDKSNFEDRKADGFVAVANSDTSFKVPLSDFNAENLGAQEKLQPAGDSSTPVYINGESKATPISSPIQPGLGGTGETTLKDACWGMINSLDTGEDTPSDNDYFISQYAGGSQAKYYRRKLIKIWDWLKSKISDKRITIKVGTTERSFTLNDTQDRSLDFSVPSVPTVNNKTITIKANGKSDSFTLNQSSDKPIDLNMAAAGSESHPVYIKNGKAIGTGAIAPGYGGTGETSLTNAGNSILWSLTEGNAGTSPNDDDYFISQYDNGNNPSVNMHTFHKRKFSVLWSWISNKLKNSYNKMFGIRVAYTVSSSRTDYAFCTPVYVLPVWDTGDMYMYALVEKFSGDFVKTGPKLKELDRDGRIQPRIAVYFVVNVSTGKVNLKGLYGGADWNELPKGQFVPIVAYTNGGASATTTYFKMDH